MRVLLFRDGDWWIAQVLDPDICTQARDMPAVIEAIQKMTYAERWLHDEDPERPANLDRFDDLPCAPVLFLQSWKKATPIVVPPLPQTEGTNPIVFEFRVLTPPPR